LRFATPASQPKLSGGNGAGSGMAASGLITAHVSGGPSVGLKNYASPSVVMHHHHHQTHRASLVVGPAGQGHQNLAMSSGSASSASCSSNSSSLGGPAAGSGGSDPLLGMVHLSQFPVGTKQQQHRMGQLMERHCQQEASGVHGHQHEHDHEDDDEDEDDDEQGVISADEATYLPRHFQAGHHHRLNEEEGFRDTNELTINADTAALPSGAGAGRRRLFPAGTAATGQQHNSMGRSSMAKAVNRRSLGVMGQHVESSLHENSSTHHHHHHNHHHHDQQSQRLVVTSSNSSNSTRSSRASPPSDDQSLDRLAYGNNWQKQT